MFQAVEDLEGVDDKDEIYDYANNKKLSYSQLILIKKLFNIYD